MSYKVLPKILTEMMSGVEGTAISRKITFTLAERMGPGSDSVLGPDASLQENSKDKGTY